MKRNLLVLMIIFTGVLSAQWSSDPAQNNAVCDLNGEQAIPKVVTGPAGDTYIGFFSNNSGNYDVRLQRLDSEGSELWVHNGILISDNPAMTWLTDWDMTVDGENHAILVFQDIRNAGNNNIYAYRIAPDGTFVWGADGIELSNSPAFSASPKVVVTSAGNIVVAWSEETISSMQKIAPDGTLQWGTAGITLSSANTISWPQPLAVDNDEILLKYFEDIGSFPALTRQCYMQKYDANGNPLWTSPTVVSNAGGISAWTQIFNIISDENNGCFISWHDSRGGGTISYPFVQHVLSDGSVGFTANGVQLSTEANRQNFYPESVYNEVSGELTTYWYQTDGDQNNYGITGQKLAADGNLLWGNNGLSIFPVSNLYVLPFAVRQADSDVIVLYEEGITSVNSYIKAMRLDDSGSFVWAGNYVTLCSVASEKVHSEASQFNQNQIIAAWEDDRNGSSDIYAQNINLDGSIGNSEPFGFIEGTVVLNGGVGNIEEVEVSFGTYITNPDINGDFLLSLPAGTYDGYVSLEYYSTVTLPTVVVVPAGVVAIEDIVLYWIPVFNPPQNVTIDPNTGYVSWDPPEPYPGAELLGYNVYLDGVLLVFLTNTFYQLENLINGLLYTVGISAVYEQGESAVVEGEFIYTGTEAGNDLIARTELLGIYPNPFNPSTTISFNISNESSFAKSSGMKGENEQIELVIYNIKGQKVKTLINDVLPVGNHSVIWNGTDFNEKPVASGIYLCYLKIGDYLFSRKLMLMK